MDVKESYQDKSLIEQDVNNKVVQSPSTQKKDGSDCSTVKTDTPTSRPCAVIAPGLQNKQPINLQPELWADHNAYYKPYNEVLRSDEHRYPARNISPRQTFQENMSRIMLPPRVEPIKQGTDAYTGNYLKQPVSKYSDVPYTLNANLSDHRKEIYVTPEPHLYPHCPPGYSASSIYQDYPAAGSMQQVKHNISGKPESISHIGKDYYRGANIRFEPYPALKEKTARYEYPNIPYIYPPHPYLAPNMKHLPHRPYLDPQSQGRIDPKVLSSHKEYNKAVESPYVYNAHLKYPPGQRVPYPNRLGYEGDGRSILRVNNPYAQGRVVGPEYDTRFRESQYQHIYPRGKLPHPYSGLNGLPRAPPMLYPRQLEPEYGLIKGLERYHNMYNPLANIPTQFSPNIISPSESVESADTILNPHDDSGYGSQCSSVSNKSIDFNSRNFSFDYNTSYDACQLQTKMQMHAKRALNKKESRENNKSLNLRTFLETWDEGFEESSHLTSQNKSKVEPQLVVLDAINIPQEELSKYEHIQKVSKLPDNIRGLDKDELLNQFEQAVGPSQNKDNDCVTLNLNPVDNEKRSIKINVENHVEPRSNSPLDFEAKISQSVIRKEAKCTFEIRPCTPSQQMNYSLNLLPSHLMHQSNNQVVKSQQQYTHYKQNGLQPSTPLHQEPKQHFYHPAECTVKPSKSQVNNRDVNQIVKNLNENCSTISNISFASLPRLDAEIELNIPEINQQYEKQNFSSLSPKPSRYYCTPTTPLTLSPLDSPSFTFRKDLDHHLPSAGLGMISPVLSPCVSESSALDKQVSHRLSKFRINKNAAVSKENLYPSNVAINDVRTDSVIIKLPDISPAVDFQKSSDQSVGILDMETIIKSDTSLHTPKEQESNFISINEAINLSLHSNDMYELEKFGEKHLNQNSENKENPKELGLIENTDTKQKSAQDIIADCDQNRNNDKSEPKNDCNANSSKQTATAVAFLQSGSNISSKNETALDELNLSEGNIQNPLKEGKHLVIVKPNQHLENGQNLKETQTVDNKTFVEELSHNENKINLSMEDSFMQDESKYANTAVDHKAIESKADFCAEFLTETCSASENHSAHNNYDSECMKSSDHSENCEEINFPEFLAANDKNKTVCNFSSPEQPLYHKSLLVEEDGASIENNAILVLTKSESSNSLFNSAKNDMSTKSDFTCAENQSVEIGNKNDLVTDNFQAEKSFDLNFDMLQEDCKSLFEHTSEKGHTTIQSQMNNEVVEKPHKAKDVLKFGDCITLEEGMTKKIVPHLESNVSLQSDDHNGDKVSQIILNTDHSGNITKENDDKSCSVTQDNPTINQLNIEKINTVQLSSESSHTCNTFECSDEIDIVGKKCANLLNSDSSKTRDVCNESELTAAEFNVIKTPTESSKFGQLTSACEDQINSKNIEFTKITDICLRQSAFDNNGKVDLILRIENTAHHSLISTNGILENEESSLKSNNCSQDKREKESLYNETNKNLIVKQNTENAEHMIPNCNIAKSGMDNIGIFNENSEIKNHENLPESSCDETCDVPIESNPEIDSSLDKDLNNIKNEVVCTIETDNVLEEDQGSSEDSSDSSTEHDTKTDNSLADDRHTSENNCDILLQHETNVIINEKLTKSVDFSEYPNKVNMTDVLTNAERGKNMFITIKSDIDDRETELSEQDNLRKLNEIESEHREDKISTNNCARLEKTNNSNHQSKESKEILLSNAKLSAEVTIPSHNGVKEPLDNSDPSSFSNIMTDKSVLDLLPDIELKSCSESNIDFCDDEKNGFPLQVNKIFFESCSEPSWKGIVAYSESSDSEDDSDINVKDTTCILSNLDKVDGHSTKSNILSSISEMNNSVINDEITSKTRTSFNQDCSLSHAYSSCSDTFENKEKLVPCSNLNTKHNSTKEINLTGLVNQSPNDQIDLDISKKTTEILIHNKKESGSELIPVGDDFNLKKISDTGVNAEQLNYNFITTDTPDNTQEKENDSQKKILVGINEPRITNHLEKALITNELQKTRTDMVPERKKVIFLNEMAQSSQRKKDLKRSKSFDSFLSCQFLTQNRKPGDSGCKSLIENVSYYKKRKIDQNTLKSDVISKASETKDCFNSNVYMEADSTQIDIDSADDIVNKFTPEEDERTMSSSSKEDITSLCNEISYNLEPKNVETAFVYNKVDKDETLLVEGILSSEPEAEYPKFDNSSYNDFSMEDNNDVWLDDVACEETVVSESLDSLDEEESLEAYCKNISNDVSYDFARIRDICSDTHEIKPMDTLFRTTHSDVSSKLVTELLESFEEEVNEMKMRDYREHCEKEMFNCDLKTYRPEIVSAAETDKELVDVHQQKIHYNVTTVSGKDGSSKTLITKAAQKYIPPIKINFSDLKIRIPLPPNKLKYYKSIKEKHSAKNTVPKLKITKSYSPKEHAKKRQVEPNLVATPKKVKPNFEDVLKTLDETLKESLKSKHKVRRKSIPKMIIKKSENGSHYSASLPKQAREPDLTGSKWQPWVYLVKDEFVDKMIVKNKTRAIFCPRTNRFAIYHPKVVPNVVKKTVEEYYAEKNRTPLKYTIKLNGQTNETTYIKNSFNLSIDER